MFNVLLIGLCKLHFNIAKASGILKSFCINFVVKKLKRLNKTIFLTTHNMNVAEKLCSRIAFINKGDILKIGTKEDIKKTEKSQVDIEIEIYKNKSQFKSELKNYDFIKKFNETTNGFIISLKERENYTDLISILAKNSVLKIKERDFSLEDLFLKFSE